MNVGDFITAVRKNGDKDVLYIVKITGSCIFTMDHNKKIERWRLDNLHKQGFQYESSEILDPDLLVDGLSTEVISVEITRYSKVGVCRCCNGGFFTKYGEFIPDTQTIYKIGFGNDSINLCPSCFSRLRMAMSFPMFESLDEFRTNPIRKSDIGFNVNLFFELMAELDKPDPSPEDIARILKGR